MGRRRKGRPLSGWVIVDKPAGLTSTSVVNKVRWAFDAQKAGHAGTLDPDATGILAIALGEATKTIPFVTDALKAYRFDIRLGAATDTDDASGTVIAESATRPDTDAIKDALHAFVGEIMQRPPAYSAVKIDGARAYDISRAGETVEIAERPLWVEELTLVDRAGPDHATLHLVCGKGGYVRSIARDLGAALGCYGHVQTLRRVWSGPFDLDHAIGLNTIEAEARTDALDARLLPVTAGLSDLPHVTATADGIARLKNGNPGQVLPGDAEYGDTVWTSAGDQPLAIGTLRGGALHPSRVLNL